MTSPSDWRSRVLTLVRKKGPMHTYAMWELLEGAILGRALGSIKRALQSLRRAGLVVYDRRRGWSVKECR